MKHHIKIYAATLMFYIGFASAEQIGPDETVVQFYDASRSGNVGKILEITSGSFYNRRKSVLENNDEYPNFLREHFNSSTTEIVDTIIDTKSRTAVVTATTHFPDRGINTSRLILKQDDTGTWKIVDEKNPEQ